MTVGMPASPPASRAAALGDRVERRPALPPVAAPPVWVVSALAGACSAEERARFADRTLAERALAERALAERALADRPDRLLLVTCHRAELYGTGPQPSPETLLALAGDGATAGRLRLRVGAGAVRHAIRLAAGLESAVVGEDQVLHQVRVLRDEARVRRLDPHLARLMEVAIGVGRRARAGRPTAGRAERDIAAEPRGEAGLAGGALDWLAALGVDLAGGELLVVGAGTMGSLLARQARSRGARVVVASRGLARAVALAAETGGEAIDLPAAASRARRVDGIAVALAGPWAELAGPAWAGAGLPPLVDLSAPPAVAPGRAGRAIDIDGLHAWVAARAAPADLAVYVTAAEALVEEAIARYLRWSAGRASVATLRDLRARADERRRAEVERLLRRVDLGPRERDLVRAFSERLVAAILHPPTAHLRDDADGSAATAARRLFDL